MKILLVSLVHNRKNLLSECVRSVISQTHKDFEYLMFDNASTDGADKMAKIFGEKQYNFNFFGNPENLGQQKAYNKILYEWIPENMPDADVIAILDSDDTLAPNAIEKVYKVYNEHPKIGGTYSGFNIIDRGGRLLVKNHAKAKYVPEQFTAEGQKKLRKLFLANNPCGHLRTYNVEALKDIGGFNTDYTYATDYNIFGRLLYKEWPVIKINEVLYNFRQHGNQVQGKHSPQQTKDWRDMQSEFRKLFKEKQLI